jgi:hypothetical protein
MIVVRLLTDAVDHTPWPGPSYDPQVFDGGFPHADSHMANHGDLYHSVMGGWYEYQKIQTGKSFYFDWIRIPGDPRER